MTAKKSKDEDKGGFGIYQEKTYPINRAYYMIIQSVEEGEYDPRYLREYEYALYGALMSEHDDEEYEERKRELLQEYNMNQIPKGSMNTNTKLYKKLYKLMMEYANKYGLGFEREEKKSLYPPRRWSEIVLDNKGKEAVSEALADMEENDE